MKMNNLDQIKTIYNNFKDNNKLSIEFNESTKIMYKLFENITFDCKISTTFETGYFVEITKNNIEYQIVIYNDYFRFSCLKNNIDKILTFDELKNILQDI